MHDKNTDSVVLNFTEEEVSSTHFDLGDVDITDKTNKKLLIILNMGLVVKVQKSL